MAGARGHAQEVGDEQSHEGDDARDRHGSGRQQRDEEDQRDPQPLHVDAQVTGGAFAEREEVQLPREEGGHGQPGQGARQDRQHLRPGGLGEGAELPEGDLGDLRVVGEEDEQADQRAREGVHGDAGEDQRHHLRTAARPRQRVHERHRDEPGGERAGRHRPVAEEAQPQRDRADRADGRARGDADDAGFGERVAEHALHQRARAPERRPDEQGEDDPRQPDVPQHALADPVQACPAEPDAVQQRAEDVADGDLVRADARREQAEDEQGGGHGRDEQGPPPSAAGGARPGRRVFGILGCGVLRQNGHVRSRPCGSARPGTSARCPYGGRS